MHNIVIPMLKTKNSYLKELFIIQFFPLKQKDIFFVAKEIIIRLHIDTYVVTYTMTYKNAHRKKNTNLHKHILRKRCHKTKQKMAKPSRKHTLVWCVCFVRVCVCVCFSLSSFCRCSCMSMYHSVILSSFCV